MGFDFIITVCTAVALLSRHSARTDLWKLLFQDGLVYFLISFSTNSIPAVFNILDLNVPMNVIATVPAASITSIAACRAVLRLLDFRSSDIYIQSFSPGMNGSQPQGDHNTGRLRIQKLRPHPEVRVTTEHITMAEFATPRSCSPYRNERRHTMSSIDHRSFQDIEALEEKSIHTSFPFPDDT
ncbi:hypothetical protein BJ165DRAFT_27604 [Panaeolus papilionaceus]|nr:hypothetical protein BJ165DRAFT_27604 [Panaeolus papilionaceus]